MLRSSSTRAMVGMAAFCNQSAASINSLGLISL